MSTVLGRLATKELEEGWPAMQVIYATHSPHFVGIDRFDSIRLARKAPHIQGAALSTRLASLTLEQLGQHLAAAAGKDPTLFSSQSMGARLQPIMTPWMNEGFFARVAVLVEGDQDRAAVLAAARFKGHDLDQLGISVIPCIGKNNIDRPALIFRGLGIKTYLIFDSDAGATRKDQAAAKSANRLLLRIAGATEEDFPSFVGERCAAFKEKIETTIGSELGADLFEGLMMELQSEFEMKRADVLKNPNVMGQLLERAAAKGHRSDTLSRIVDAIIQLTGTPSAA
jgi:putative ATP-dependent endonuclease of the OLD family